MNAMLEPRMVAVRIQNFASAPHGLPSPADRIMASSQGAFMKATDASLIGITPEKHDPVNRLLVGGHSYRMPTFSRDRQSSCARIIKTRAVDSGAPISRSEGPWVLAVSLSLRPRKPSPLQAALILRSSSGASGWLETEIPAELANTTGVMAIPSRASSLVWIRRPWGTHPYFFLAFL